MAGPGGVIPTITKLDQIQGQNVTLNVLEITYLISQSAAVTSVGTSDGQSYVFNESLANLIIDINAVWPPTL